MSYTYHRQYDDDELEYLLAVEKYKKDNDIRFPHVCEYLHIAKRLGYKKGGDK